MSSRSLKYGHIIRIKPNDPHVISYVTSKSYTDPKLYFQTYGVQDRDFKVDVSNFRESLFEVLPTSSFQINDQMNSLKSQAKKLETAPRAKTQQQQFKAAIDQKRGNLIFFGDKVVFRHLDSKHYIYGSFDCAQSGIGAFKIDLRRQLSQKLIFQLFSYRTYEKSGDEISIDAPLKIYHYETQCYLSYCLEPIFLDRDAEKISRNEKGQYQQIMAPYILPSLRLFYATNSDQQYSMQEVDEDQSVMKQKKELDQNCRFQIINQNIAKRIWKFEPYLDVQSKPQKQIIRNHDIVYLLHTKDDKYLCPSNFADNIYLNKRIDAQDPSYIFDGLWEIQVKIENSMDQGQLALKNAKLSGNKKGGLGNSFYPLMSLNMSFRKTNNFTGSTQFQKKEDKSKSKGSQKVTYSLRHLISGRVLFFSIVGGHKENIQIKLIHPNDENYRMERQNEKHGFVMLQCLQSNLVDGALTRLNIDSGKYYLEVKQKKKNQLFLKSKEQPEVVEEEQRIKLNLFEQDDEIEQTYQSNFDKQDLQTVKDASEHGFRIYKVEESIKQIALMIMSSQEIIEKFMKFLSFFDPTSILVMKNFNMTVLNNVINVIKGLIGFIYDCDYSKIVSSGNSPIALRQRAFDEIGMVELVTGLINEIQRKDEELKHTAEQKGKNSEYKKIRTIYSLGYQVLQSMAAYNFMLKIKISKYLEVYLRHIINPENRIIYKSIQQILDGNELALEKKVKQSYIKELIGTFGQKDTAADPADLQFLSKLCLCKNRTVQKNQNAVFIAFYEQNRNTDNKFQFQQDHGKYQIASKISKKQDPRLRTLPQLYLQCQMSQTDGVLDPSKGHWNYFIQYLNLLADVCVHRNIAPLRYISDNLPLKTLNQFLQEKLVRNKLLHQPFIRLVHHAFVENENFKQISRITKVKNWNNLGDFSIPRSKHPVSRQINNIIQIVVEYIKKINLLPWSQEKKKIISEEDEEPASIEFDPDNMTSLKNINTFLEILKSTLILGFWPSMNDLKKLVPYMLKILSFDIEYANRIASNPEVRKQIVHVSEEDLLNKVYNKVKQQLRLNKENITLLVRCKILAAKILDIIIDYQFNIRVSIITKHFRDVQEQEVNLKDFPYKEYEFKKKWKNDKQYEIFRPSNQKQGYLMNEELWTTKINQIIQKGDVFQYCHEVEGRGGVNPNGEKGLYGKGIDWLLVLFEAFIYGDRELTDIILSIIIRTTHQRQGMLNTFKDIILVAGGNLNKLTDRVLITRNSLLKLATQQVYDETYAKGNLWKKFKPGLNTDGNALGTIQQLAFLTISMKQNQIQTQVRASKLYAMVDLYPFKQFDENIFELGQQLQSDRSLLIITEKDENNLLNQNLIKGQDHHLLILTFIKLMQKIPKQKFPMMALHASYNFLTVLVWNNIENKNQLQPILPQAQNHISINVGCIDFFHQMYKNNSKLVLKTDVTIIVNKIIEQANKQDIKFYHKSKLLDFLRTILIFDNKGIEKNQNIVMEIISQYQVSENNQIVYLKVNDGISKTIENGYEAWMEEYMLNYNSVIDTYQNLLVSPELFYIATFFQIFSGLIQNQNKVNIGKCTNMHPHDFLIKILKKYRPCWPVVRHLRSYINKLYYFETRDKDTQLFNQFIAWDLQNIKQELRGIMTIILNAPDYNTIRIQNPIRYTFLGSYIFLCLEECLHSLCLMFSLKDFIQYLLMTLNQEGKQSQDIYFSLLFMVEMVEYLMKTIDGRYINNYLQLTSKYLKVIISQCPLKMVQKYIEHQKKEMKQHMSKHKFSPEESLFRKNYTFHENKGFWRHLIDWNAHIEQQNQRQKAMNALTKKNEKDFSGGTDTDDKKKRDYLLDKIYLAKIQNLILVKDPQRRVMPKEDVGEQFGKKQQEMADEGSDNVLPKNLVTSQSQRFKVKNQRFKDAQQKNSTINERRKKLVKFIQINPELSNFASEETVTKLYNGFANLSNSSKTKYGIQVVGKEDVIKTLVDMNRRDPKSIKLQYKVEIIKMFTSFIQKQSAIFKQEVDSWSLTDKEQIQRVKECQNFLNDCNCAEFLCSLFQNDMNQSIKMSNEIVMFGICLLFNKNTNVQNSILQILKRDEKNVILTQLDQLIKKNSISIAYYKPYEAKHQFPIPRNYSDTFDFFLDSQKIMERKFTYIPETVLEQKQFEEKMVFLQRIFIFMKVLCEGSNEVIKNYIRDQSSGKEDGAVNAESINFIALSAAELKRLFTNFRMQILKVPFAIVDFINEVTRIPCIRNQLFLCQDTTYFHDFAQLEKVISQQIRKNLLTNEQIQKLSSLFAQNIKNCLSCLQGNHQKIRISLISGDLHTYYAMIFKFFITTLPLADPHWNFASIEELQIQMSNCPTYDGKILHLFDISTVIMKLKIKYPKFKENVEYDLDKIEVIKYFELFEKNQLGIEIKMDKSDTGNQQIQIEYFPCHPVFPYLSRTTRGIIMDEIDRNTQRDKIIGLINTTEEITQQIDYNFTLDHSYKIGGYPIEISSSKIAKFQSVSLVFAMVICILVTSFATVVYYPDDKDIEYDLGDYFFLIQVLSAIEFIFATIYGILWYINHSKMAVGKYELILKSQMKKQGKTSLDQVQIGTIQKILFKIPGLKVLYCLATYDKDFFGLALFIFGSVLGTFYKSQWFSVLILIIMMKKMDVLKSMIDSVTSKIDMLFMLSLLGTAFIAIFSIFSLNFYLKSLYEEELPDQHCYSVFDCIIQLYTQGQINSQMQSFESGRFLFDMIYMIFMDTLFNEILSGVVIDTFTELRQKHEEIINDKQNLCFICGITRQVLQKKNQDIKTHYQCQNHKLWNYVFYIYNLNLKGEKVGLELIISDKIQKEDVSWVPVQSGDQEDIGERITALQNAIIAQKDFITQLEITDS